LGNDPLPETRRIHDEQARVMICLLTVSAIVDIHQARTHLSRLLEKAINRAPVYHRQA
jgi:hypothetical protein